MFFPVSIFFFLLKFPLLFISSLPMGLTIFSFPHLSSYSFSLPGLLSLPLFSFLLLFPPSPDLFLLLLLLFFFLKSSLLAHEAKHVLSLCIILACFSSSGSANPGCSPFIYSYPFNLLSSLPLSFALLASSPLPLFSFPAISPRPFCLHPHFVLYSIIVFSVSSSFHTIFSRPSSPPSSSISPPFLPITLSQSDFHLPFLHFPTISSSVACTLSTSVTAGGRNLSVSLRAKGDQGKQSGV